MLVHRHNPPDRFVVGTVGEPGARTFFLQARSGRLVTSVSLEKEQVAILAERIGVLLDELVRTGDVPAGDALATSTDIDPLDQPLVEEFRVGTMTLSWDGDDKQVVIEAFPVGEDDVEPGDSEADDDTESGPGLDDAAEVSDGDEGGASEVLLVRLGPAAARAFADRADTVVSAGRPPCPFCGQPLDPAGHLCPRANGYKRVAR
ncbi:MAG: DUF3090 family protein [Actinomycetota bacterium]|nr:DUF3090 family protein [Nocardioidaceae bacterium]MDQ3591346.1 DUF3090 family protein [Actinomycetota bacterium]